MVHRDGPIFARIGKGSGGGCPLAPEQGQGCVIAPMEFDVGVQRGEGFLRVTPWSVDPCLAQGTSP